MTVTERSKPQIKPVTERSKPQIKRDDWQRAYTNNFDSVMFHKIDILCTNHLTTTTTVLCKFDVNVMYTCQYHPFVCSTFSIIWALSFARKLAGFNKLCGTMIDQKIETKN